MVSISKIICILIFILISSGVKSDNKISNHIQQRFLIKTNAIQKVNKNEDFRMLNLIINEITKQQPISKRATNIQRIHLLTRRRKRFSNDYLNKNENNLVECCATNSILDLNESSALTASRRTGPQFTGKQGQNDQTTSLFSLPATAKYVEQSPVVITNDNKTIIGVKLKTSGELKFLDVPPGGGMITPGLELDDGYSIFSFISTFLRYLQVSEFPSDLVKDWIWNQLSLIQLVIQTVRVEGGIIACLSVFVLFAVALPTAVLAQISCRRSVGAQPDPELTDAQLRGRKLVLIVLLQLMLILLPLGIVGMFLSNEHLAQSVQRSPEIAHAVLEDLHTFVRNTRLQIRFVATTSVDQAVDQAISDLDDVDRLLGRPIQRELATETGVDVALDALFDICAASADIATEVLTLRAEGQAARDSARIAQERLLELQKQVDTAVRQCVIKDKPLCDTIDTSGLDVTFKIDKMLGERKLSRLRHLAEDNLTTAAHNARTEYHDIPLRIIKDTAIIRDAIDEVSHDFASSITVAHGHVTRLVRTVTDTEPWRWATGFGSSLSVLLIWIILTSGLICVNCGCANRVIPSFLIALIMICIISIFLWTVAAVALVIGGNGEIFICHSLYDSPNYETLSLLLDNPGLFYKYGGMFSNILKGNHSMNVPIKNLLRECRLNQPAFPTLSLNRVFNIDAITNHLTWPKLHGHLSNLTVNIGDIEILKPALQKYLQDISHASRVNLTLYRSQLSGSLTGTELGTFADQLERIANQMSDLTTSARLETLASRSRKLLSNNLQRLEKHRDEIVYKLTALQVHLLPLQRQANQSLSHLKTIQYFLTNQGSAISEKKTNEYIRRLINYLERFREHVLNQLTYEVSPCRPLWDIFESSRIQLCKHLVAPMNSFWVSTVWCLLIFISVTPVIIISIDYYRNDYSNGDFRRDLDELLVAEQGPWTTSTPHSTPETLATPEQSSWATLRRPSEQLLIVPQTRRSPIPSRSPRRIAETRSRLSPRPRAHESLRMIEASTCRNHNIPSPRGWL